MPYPFAQDLTVTFYPIVGDEKVTPSGDSPSIYYFDDDNKPDRDDALNGTNAINSGSAITSWSNTSDGDGKSFTVPAIPDPDSSDDKEVYTYWLGVNFTLETSGDTVTVIRALPMRRVDAHLETLVLSDSDLTERWPAVDDYTVDSSQRDAFIDDAIEDIKEELWNKGYEWARIHEADRLKAAAVYRTLAMIALSQIREENDRFGVLHRSFMESYQKKISRLRMLYDSDNSKEVDSITKNVRSSINIV